MAHGGSPCFDCNGVGAAFRSQLRKLAFAILLLSPALLFFLSRDSIIPNKISSRRMLFNEYQEESFFSIPENLESLLDIEDLPAPAPLEPLPPYSFADVLDVGSIFRASFMVLIWDPEEDLFTAYYDKKHRWKSTCYQVVISMKSLVNSLRILYPDRFQKGISPELAIPISSGDFPHIQMNDCFVQHGYPCVSENAAPILHFGSVFKSPMVPTLIAMPMPQLNHLSCFHQWAQHDAICHYYLPRSRANPIGLVFEEEVGLSWDDLTPQLVWRGTDFNFLNYFHPELRKPNFALDIETNIDQNLDIKDEATRAMRKVFNSLMPRWKGVVYTAEAEREAEKNGGVPWANIKFSGCMHLGKKTRTSEVEYYQQFDNAGIPASGESMSLETLAEYKYHIDLGGGGGTTWSGTLEKLGLPGLLFHHETLTKDYLHDMMIPWVHYVPVREDLSDLKEKFDWAEQNPQLARKISARATMLAKSFGTPDGMRGMFSRFFEQPIRHVVQAYQPLTRGTWKQIMEQKRGDDLYPVISCVGQSNNDCEAFVDWMKTGEPIS